MTTKLRMVCGLAAILLPFGLALVITQIALRQIGEAEAELATVDEAKHAGYLAVAELRNQHVQQVHLMFENTTDHLRHYDRADAAAREAITRLITQTVTPEERVLANRIAATAGELDRGVREVMLPALRRGDRFPANATAARAGELVDAIADTNAELVGALERRAAVAATNATQMRDRARLLTVACFGLAFVCAGLVAFALVRSITRPLARLGEGVRDVSVGKLGSRIDLIGTDEFAQLARAFDRMTAALQSQQEALVRSQKLASIGQVAAGVAHEINNPLTVILGYARLASRANGAMEVERVRLVEQEAVACQRIVKGLLDLARPQQLEIGEVDLEEIARAAVQLVRDSEDVPDDLIRVDAEVALHVAGDPGLLRQVIANLLRNAIHAAVDRVAIRVVRDDIFGRVIVEDDGPGIPPDVRARAFDPFFTTKHGGTGLGLAIAQSIADAHGGRIELASAQGCTRATLSIPLANRQGPIS